MSGWDGVQWDTAPVGATDWVFISPGRSVWLFKQPTFMVVAGRMRCLHGESVAAPDFGYSGHWLNSHRRRPWQPSDSYATDAGLEDTPA